MKLFVQILYDKEKRPHLIKVKKVLRQLNLQMSLAEAESPKGATFSRWLYCMLVRPFSELMADIVKKLYDSLEIEDLGADLDLERVASKAKQDSRKRKLSPVIQVEEASPPKKAPPFKRRQLVPVEYRSETELNKSVSFVQQPTCASQRCDMSMSQLNESRSSRDCSPSTQNSSFRSQSNERLQAIINISKGFNPHKMRQL